MPGHQQAAHVMNDRSSLDDVPVAHPSPARCQALDALGEFARCRLDRYHALAATWLRRFHINRTRFGPDDAIGEALLTLCRRIEVGSISFGAALDELERWFPSILRQVIIDRGRFQHAGKRHGGRETIYLSMLEGSDLERICARSAGPEEVAAAAEEFWNLLDRLRRRRSMLQVVAVMRIDGHSTEDIARTLGVSTAAVKRCIKSIQSQLEPPS